MEVTSTAVKAAFARRCGIPHHRGNVRRSLSLKLRPRKSARSRKPRSSRKLRNPSWRNLSPSWKRAKIRDGNRKDAAASWNGPVEAGVRVVEVVPGPCANKDAVGEPFRTVVSVRRAAKRIGGKKPVLAYRGRVVNTVTRPECDFDYNLRLGIRCRQRQKGQQGKIFSDIAFSVSLKLQPGIT